MKFNNNKALSADGKTSIVRFLAVAIIVIVAVVLFAILIPRANIFASNLTINELIASITLLVSIGVIAFKVSEKVLHQNYTAKRRIQIDATPKGEYTTIMCKIENCGKKRIVPQNIYLLVEKGLEKDGLVTFPYLLKHEKDEFDCVLANLLKKGGVNSVPDQLVAEEYRNSYRKVIKMQHLSSETILFVDPGEEFTEDVTLQLEKGVYRATVVWTSVKEDCICTTKEFVV